MNIIVAMLLSYLNTIGGRYAIACSSSPVEDIYGYAVKGIDGDTIQLGRFRGKKMLFVNLATGSPRVAQIGELQQLQEQMGDKVVVIGFPSNSFGHEPRNNEAIKALCETQYQVGFRLAAVGDVAGSGCQTVYQWLADANKNGVAAVTIQNDYEKVLLNGEARIVGMFAPSVSPTDSTIVNAILEN